MRGGFGSLLLMWLYNAFFYLLVRVVCLFVLFLGELGRKSSNVFNLMEEQKGVEAADPKDRVVLRGLLLIISRIAI